MNRFCLFWGMIFWCAANFSAHAVFSSIYIFGDSVSATTTNFATGSQTNWYYGKRYSNGRTWVEILAQRQGLGANSLTTNVWNYSSNNASFWGNYSPLLVTNAFKFTAPNASNSLFIIWVCDADFVGDETGYYGLPTGPNDNYTAMTNWTTTINQHLTNHFKAIMNLYTNGMRTLVAPNAVDINWIPLLNGNPSAYRTFVRQRIVSFNTNYLALMQQIEILHPDLKIIVPDFFSALDGAVTNSAAYGLTNALYSGATADVVDAYTNYHTLSSIALNGPGTNYIFWDDRSPTAKLSELFADTAQQALSPPVFSGMTPVNGSNRIDIASAPVGMNGTILFATNLPPTAWFTNSTFTVTNVSQSVFVNPTNASRFYSLKFPWQWSWP